MSRILRFATFLSLASATSVCAQQASSSNAPAQMEEGKLTADEVKYFRKLKSFNKEFIFTNKVRRFYATNADSSTTSIVSQLIFDKDEMFIAVNGQSTEYIAYDVSFVDSAVGGILVSYTFSAGRGFTGDGSAIINDQSVVETTYACGGNGNCSFEIRKNGVVMSAGSKPASVAGKPAQKATGQTPAKGIQKFCKPKDNAYCLLTITNGTYVLKVVREPGNAGFTTSYTGKLGGKNPTVIVSGNSLLEMTESDDYVEWKACK